MTILTAGVSMPARRVIERVRTISPSRFQSHYYRWPPKYIVCLCFHLLALTATFTTAHCPSPPLAVGGLSLQLLPPSGYRRTFLPPAPQPFQWAGNAFLLPLFYYISFYYVLS